MAEQLRATLLQSTHHFAGAMRDLDAVVAARPTRATVQTVRGEYAAASASCARLSSLTTELVSITGIANVAGMNGRAAAAKRRPLFATCCRERWGQV